MNFALNLKTLREEQGLSQVKLAEIFKVSKGAVGLWETGQRTPKAEQLIKIANFFNVTVSDLLGENTNLTKINENTDECESSIGEAIEKLRKNNQMTYRAFAEVTGYDSGYLYQIEKGRSSSKIKKEVIPNINILKQICDKTGYDFALFLTETGYLNPERVCMNDDEIKALRDYRDSLTVKDLAAETILNQLAKLNSETSLKNK